MEKKNEIVLFETDDKEIKLSVPVDVEQETVWLNRNQMADLFDRDVKTIGKHINNALREELDAQLGEVIQIMKRNQNSLDSKQVLSVIEKYSTALDLLDAYDHQNMERPKGKEASYVLTYEECTDVISSMRFGDESDLFGKEKDDSFKGSIGNIYQSFGGKDVYPTLEEKAAHLLYFVTKNHSFLDGNKRIAATMFLYFLDKNGVLFVDGEKTIEDHTLVALTIMIAESKPDEMEMMITVIMNCMR